MLARRRSGRYGASPGCPTDRAARPTILCLHLGVVLIDTGSPESLNQQPMHFVNQLCEGVVVVIISNGESAILTVEDRERVAAPVFAESDQVPQRIFFCFLLAGCISQLVNALYYMTENLGRFAVSFQFIVDRR